MTGGMATAGATVVAAAAAAVATDGRMWEGAVVEPFGMAVGVGAVAIGTPSAARAVAWAVAWAGS